MQSSSTAMLVVLLAASTGCGGAVVHAPAKGTASVPLAELWADPGNESRDLVYGIGGSKLAPDPDGVYALLDKDDVGFSVSYDVKGPDGTEWSAKIGPEAQTEVLVSHLLWGLGYHQPPTYYLPKWKLAGKNGQVETISEARFRRKVSHLKHDGSWLWTDNPFAGTRQLNGLLSMLVILNATDLKPDNNAFYKLEEPWDGAARWWVVRDVGAALGETGRLFPRRNWLEGFEREPFILKVDGARITFGYRGRHQELLDMLTPADVHWAAERLSMITDDQWHALFRYTNYADPIADRFIRRVKEKIADGLKLPSDAPAESKES